MRKGINSHKKFRLALLALAVIATAIFAVSLLQGHNFAVLNPEGEIAQKQFNLIIITLLLSLIVVVPVFGLTFYIVWKYRVGNKRKASYRPDWAHNHWLEAIWWLIPLAIIAILAVITWQSSHQLDPFKKIESSKKPLTIQVVALQWKWLFIYPEQQIATINAITFPKDTPLNFELTADAPMNSFWIPQLGGQIYTMTGMSTKLHLIADKVGDYRGVSANISGRGFAGMKFTASSRTQSDFDAWVQSVKTSPHTLTPDTYNSLAEPSENNPPAYYASVDADLYTTIMMKYMVPGGHH